MLQTSRRASHVIAVLRWKEWRSAADKSHSFAYQSSFEVEGMEKCCIQVAKGGRNGEVLQTSRKGWKEWRSDADQSQNSPKVLRWQEWRL